VADGLTKNGVSAASLKPLLGLGSYETAWAMCHKLRAAMGRTSLDLLSGDVEVDETFISGVKGVSDGYVCRFAWERLRTQVLYGPKRMALVQGCQGRSVTGRVAGWRRLVRPSGRRPWWLARRRGRLWSARWPQRSRGSQGVVARDRKCR